MIDQSLDSDPYLPPLDSLDLPKGVFREADRLHRMEIKERALSLLEEVGERLEEIVDEVEMALYLTQSKFMLEFIEKLESKGVLTGHIKETERLRFVMNKIIPEIEEGKSQRNKQSNYWPEYFAIVALHRFSQAGQVMRNILREKDELQNHLKERLISDANFYLFDAMEAIGEAENLFNKREKLRKAGKASRKEQRLIKEKLIKYYEKHENKYSHKTKLVRSFVDTLDDQEKGWFMKGNLERTLLDHIRKYQKKLT